MKKVRLKYLRKVRKIRDEILNCDNIGRGKYLLMKLPKVQGYLLNGYVTSYQVQKYCTLYMKGGYEYDFTGYGGTLEQIKSMAKFAYNKFLINNLK